MSANAELARILQKQRQWAEGCCENSDALRLSFPKSPRIRSAPVPPPAWVQSRASWAGPSSAVASAAAEANSQAKRNIWASGVRGTVARSGTPVASGTGDQPVGQPFGQPFRPQAYSNLARGRALGATTTGGWRAPSAGSTAATTSGGWRVPSAGSTAAIVAPPPDHQAQLQGKIMQMRSENSRLEQQVGALRLCQHQHRSGFLDDEFEISRKGQRDLLRQNLQLERRNAELREQLQLAACRNQQQLQEVNKGRAQALEQKYQQQLTKEVDDRTLKLQQEVEAATQKNQDLQRHLRCLEEDGVRRSSEKAVLQQQVSKLDYQVSRTAQHVLRSEKRHKELLRDQALLLDRHHMARLQKERDALQTEVYAGKDVQNALAQETTLADELVAENWLLASEAARLRAELASVRKFDLASIHNRCAVSAGSREASHSGQAAASGNQLRVAMVDSTATSAQLRQAIQSAEALVEQASCELTSKERREHQGSFERLDGGVADAHDVTEQPSADDLTFGEQRAARIADEVFQNQTNRAFHFIQKDDVVDLRCLVDGLAPDEDWQKWEDYKGRTLLMFAKEMRSAQVEEYLTTLLQKPLMHASQSETSPKVGITPQQRAPIKVTCIKETTGVVEIPLTPAVVEIALTPSVADFSASTPKRETVTREKTDSPCWELSMACEAKVLFRDDATHAMVTNGLVSPCTTETTASPASPLLPSEEDVARCKKAFRAVVADNVEKLADALGGLAVDTWSKWINKAGTDLLTLSEERGSEAAYAWIVKALGLLFELKRERYEEREDVWVFERGEVQPRRATVMEDTPEDQDHVFVEFWDGDAPPLRVESCLVRKRA